MSVGLRFATRLISVLLLIPSLLWAQVAQPVQPLDRHARKIQRTLASCLPGSMVMIVMNDNTTRLGSVGELAGASFELTRRTGEVLRLSYADVRKVRVADQQTSNQVIFRHHSRWIAGAVLLGLIATPVILVACCDR